MKQKIIIVNNKNKIIGYKYREKLNTRDIYRVTALWVTNIKGDILLAKRAYNKSLSPGEWGPAVAGTVEKGETYYSNIIKEAREEIGLKNIKPKKGPIRRRTGKHNYFGQWYLLTIDKELNEFKILKKEVAEIKWFSKKALLKEIKKNPGKFLSTMKRIIEILC